MKRKQEMNTQYKTSYEPHAKRQKKELAVCNEWTSASKFSNYLRDDPILDYFSKIKIEKTLSLPKNEQFNVIIEKGNQFEEMIIKKIQEIPGIIYYEFPNDVRLIMDFKTHYNTVRLLETEKYDVIFHGVLRNFDTKTFGSPDIIMRGKCIKKIFQNPPNVEDDFYYIIDIKLSKLCLTSDGKSLSNNLLNNGYKGQVYIYVEALNQILNTRIASGFILGNGYTYTRGKDTFTSNDPFEQLGEINFAEKDLWIDRKMRKAVEWINNLNENYKNWTLNPPSVPELYPNMKNTYDGNYRSYKEKIAKEIGEITTMWNCGISSRKEAFKNGVFTIFDANLSPEILGFSKESKRYQIIKNMIDMKTSENFIQISDENDVHNWRSVRLSDSIFLDIETIMQDKNNWMYIIGLYYQGEYVNFVMNELTEKEEERVLGEMISFLKDKGNCKVFHWGKFEKCVFDKKFKKYNKTINWELCDMIEIFKNPDHPIILKNTNGFSIKEISSELRKQGLIETYYDNITNGFESMFKALRCYEKGEKLSPEIIEYNKKDCELMFEILFVLKTLI